jgi:hypothetical protein
MKLTNVKVTYCSNYNGCYISTPVDGDECSLDEFPEHAEKYGKVVTDIVDFAVDDCDEDGEFEGSIKALREFATKVVKEAFGKNVKVTFEVDSFST